MIGLKIKSFFIGIVDFRKGNYQMKGIGDMKMRISQKFPAFTFQTLAKAAYSRMFWPW